MGRPNGGKNKYYSKEEKIKYVKLMIENGYSPKIIEKEYGISHSITNIWRQKYLKNGENGLINKKKPGNPLCKYSNKKNLNSLEKLEYENMKLRIENELLKKGYLMKGDGTLVTFRNKNK